MREVGPSGKLASRLAMNIFPETDSYARLQQELPGLFRFGAAGLVGNQLASGYSDQMGSL